MATALKIILHDRVKDGGLQTLQFRITKGEKKYITTGYSIKKKDWDEDNLRVKKSHSNHEFLNVLLDNKFSEYQQKILILEMENPDCTAQDIKDFILSGVTGSGNSFFKYAYQYLAVKFPSPKDFNDHKSLKSVIKQFEIFAGPDITFRQITSNLLEAYIDHMKKEGFMQGGKRREYKTSTIRKKVSRLRPVFKKAVKDKIIKKEENPFNDEIELPKVNEPIVFRLTMDEIRLIEAVEVTPGTWLAHAKYTFLFQFYNMGMRIGDVILLRRQDIIQGRLLYSMQKTDKPKNIPLSQKSIDIINLYSGRDNEYVFGLFSEEQKKTPYEKTSNILTALNKNLKILAKKAGIEINLKTHTARHSALKYADDMGIDRKFIQEMASHSKPAELARYLDRIQNTALDAEFLKIQEKMK